MLFFLSIAAGRGFCVDSYVDDAAGAMGKDAAGKFVVTADHAASQDCLHRRAPAVAKRYRLHAPRSARRVLHRQLGENGDSLRAGLRVSGAQRAASRGSAKS